MISRKYKLVYTICKGLSYVTWKLDCYSSYVRNIYMPQVRSTRFKVTVASCNYALVYTVCACLQHEFASIETKLVLLQMVFRSYVCISNMYICVCSSRLKKCRCYTLLQDLTWVTPSRRFIYLDHSYTISMKTFRL